jgi:hypothetical protein
MLMKAGWEPLPGRLAFSRKSASTESRPEIETSNSDRRSIAPSLRIT